MKREEDAKQEQQSKESLISDWRSWAMVSSVAVPRKSFMLLPAKIELFRYPNKTTDSRFAFRTFFLLELS